jgi:hypothetical protein
MGGNDRESTQGISPEEKVARLEPEPWTGTSSYWSVVEEYDFRKCLEYFGWDWQAIANHMGTKTSTMVFFPHSLQTLGESLFQLGRKPFPQTRI